MAIESSITTTTSSIKITWTGLSSSTSYLVNNQLYTGSGKTGYVSGKSEIISGKTSYSYTFSSLNAGTDYYLYSTLEFSSGGTASSVRDKKVTTTPYYLTIKAGGDGIDYFTFNGTKYNSGDTLSYKNGQSITMKAVLKSNATFSKWTTSPTSLSTVHNKTSTSITFNMPAYDVTITGTANLPKKYYLTLAKTGSGVSNFTVNSQTFSSGDKLEYLEGQTVKVTANMSSNYSFVEWTSTASGIVTSSNKNNKTISFDMPTTDFTLTAKGEKTVVKYDVKTSYYTETPNKEGTYGNPYNTETRTCTEGASVTLNNLIYSSDTHNFSYATINGTKYTSTSTSFTVNQDCTVKIYYVPKSYNLKLTGEDGVSSFSVKKGDSSAVSVTAGNTTSVKHGWTVQITAKIDDGYKFWYWWQTQTNGPLTSNSYDNPLTFTMPAFAYQLNAVGQTATYTAQAFRTNYTSAISAVSPSNAVSVSSGTSQSFSATVNYGYLFSGWYTGTSTSSTRKSLDNPYSLEITENTKLYARADSTDLSFSNVTATSFTVKLTTAYNYNGEYDYKINVYKIINSSSSEAVLNGKEITYKDVASGYLVDGLDPNSKYAVNIAYKAGPDANFQWIWASGAAPTVSTKSDTVYVTAYVHIQGKDGNESSSDDPEDPYTISHIVTSSIKVETFANTIYEDYLVDDVANKLYQNIEFNKMTIESGITLYKDDYYSTTSDETVHFYFNRKTYYMTLAATTGVTNFTINSSSFNIGNTLSFFYEQSINITANLSSSYEFKKWTAPTNITAVNEKTSNPLAFTMPASDFTITANVEKIIKYYYIYVKPYYEWADAYGYDDKFGESRIEQGFAEGTGMIPSQYNLWANPDKAYNNNIEFSLFEVKDENDTVITSVSNIQKDRHLKYYYKRQVHTLTVKQDANKAVTSFTINDDNQSFGTALSYKQGQTLNFKFTLKNNYAITAWEYTGQTISLPASNEFSILMFNWSLTITPVTKQGIADWKWEDYEIEAFEGRGAFSTLTADRWNEFLDWCNKVLTLKGKTIVEKDYYGEEDQPLYASDFNYIIDRLEAVATIPSSISSTKSKGDIIKGSYFIDIAKAMNDIL